VRGISSRKCGLTFEKLVSRKAIGTIGMLHDKLPMLNVAGVEFLHRFKVPRCDLLAWETNKVEMFARERGKQKRGGRDIG